MKLLRKAIRKFLKESLHEDIEDFNGTESDIATKVAQKLNIDKVVPFSNGSQGFAYYIPNNRVLKITKDRSEVVEANKIKGKNFKHLADVYNTYNLTGVYEGTYVIINELLSLSEDINNADDIVYSAAKQIPDIPFLEFFHHYGKGNLDQDEVELIITQIKKVVPQDELKLVCWYMEQKLALINELKAQGIKSLDYGPTNLGLKKDGSLAMFDLGYGDNDFSAFAKVQDVHLNEEELQEYLSQDASYLKSYFKSSDKDKLSNLPHAYSYLFDDFKQEMDEEEFESLSQGLDFNEEIYEIIDQMEISNPELYNRFAQWLYDGIQNHSLGIGDADYPSWSFYDSPTIIKKQWLIHFTAEANAHKIAQNGFEKGVMDIDKLGLTNYLSSFDKDSEGYNFAYTLSDAQRYAKTRGGYKYGDTAIIFVASGIKLWHHGDEEPQVIFYGPDARHINMVAQDSEGMWNLESKKTGRPIFRAEELEDVMEWINKHYSQYRGHIS